MTLSEKVGYNLNYENAYEDNLISSGILAPKYIKLSCAFSKFIFYPTFSVKCHFWKLYLTKILGEAYDSISESLKCPSLFNHYRAHFIF